MYICAKSTNMKSNSYQNQRIRGLKRKIEVVNSFGGCCSNCGYRKNLAALEFHHVNPEEKDFQLDVRHLSNRNLKTLENELSKCILLCANCHRELHNPHLNEVNYIDFLNTSKSSFSTSHGKNCIVCNTNFKKVTGKIYCSKKCMIEHRNYPTKDDIIYQYNLLKNWKKVYTFFNITRKITERIINT